MKRRGFALLSAILIAAFMLAVVTGIGATLASQVRSQEQAGVSKKAFYYAEVALQDSFLAASNEADITGIRAYLLAPSNSSLTWNENGASAVHVVGDARAFTWVKAKAVFDSHNKLLQCEFVAESVVCDRDVSALSPTQLAAGTGFNVLARRVITLATSGLSVTKQGSVFKYGLFAGLDITQNGHSDYQGDPPGIDIYSDGDISMNGGTTLNGIDVYAHGTVDVTVVGGLSQAHSRELTVAPIDLVYWQSQFQAFLAGNAPYDGSDPSYMNTNALFNGKISSTDHVSDHIQSILGHLAPASDPAGNKYARPQDVATLCTDLAGKTTPSGALAGMDSSVYQQLQSTLSRTVFYVEDAGLLNATIQGGDVSGVLVCPGALTFNANGSSVGSGAVFICEGDLTFDGKGFFTGTFLTDGDAGFTKDGSGTVYGSIIAPNGSITFNGKEDVTLVNFAVGNAELDEHFQAVETMSSGWSEADLGAFTVF